MNKKRIYIISEAWDGCYYYRAEVFARYSKNFKVDSNVDYKRGIIKNPFDCLDTMMDSDIIVFLRPTRAEDLLLVYLLRAQGKTIVFSSDDSFATLDKKNPSYIVKKNLHINESFLKISDYAITTTEPLKREFEKINKKVSIIPNLIDFEEVSANYIPHNNKNIRVGLVGSVQTAENAENFLNTLEQIYKKHHNVTFVFFGGEDKKMNHILKQKFSRNAEFVKPSTITEYAKVLASLKLDIALIPRKDNYFNRCKSNCKYLELSALKIATIAQGFADGQSPYQTDIIDGENGFIAKNENDWGRMLEKVVNDADLRKKLQEESYKLVKDKYDIKNFIFLWDDFFLKIIQEKGLSKQLSEDEKTFIIKGFNGLKKETDNLKKENRYLFREIDRIRNRPFYKAVTIVMDKVRKINGKKNYRNNQ